MANKPIRCFEGNTRPHEPFWAIRNAADGAEPEMELNGFISEYSWLDDDITPKLFKDDLYKMGAGGPITIRMTSYGGDVIAASLIHTIIRDYPGRVTVQIDGVAASAATVVAVAGDVVRMQETAYFMIHDPLAVFFLAALNIEEMGRLLDSLKAIKEGIVNAYETKTGLSRPRIGNLMAEETWMDAQRALDLGFVDEVIRGTAKQQIVLPDNVAVANFVNIPAALRAILEQPAPVESVVNPEAERLRAEIKLYKKK